MQAASYLMEMSTASHLVLSLKGMVECHHKTADTVVIGLSADASNRRPQTKQTAKHNGDKQEERHAQ
jgi:hypothetical protein